MTIKQLIGLIFIFGIAFPAIAQSDPSEIELEKKPKKVTIAAIPYINYSRTIEFSYGLLTAGYYKLNSRDTISPSSSTSLVGIYSTSESYVALAAQQFFFAEDTWRAKIVVGTGTGNLQFYQNVFSGGSFIDYSTRMRFAIGNVSRRITRNLFVGISGGLANARTEFDLDLPLTERRPVIDIPVNYLGTFLQSDSRDNVNYPTSGHNIMVDFKDSGEWLGSESNFSQLELTFDYYKELGSENRIFLARYYSNSSFGDVPFIGEQTVGGDNIRGYSEGRYRDDELYSIQGEYRHKFQSRFGMVAFGGFATVVPEISEFFDHELLPGIGAGIRYRLLEKEKINIGLDVAFGKDDWSLSFRISDAFAR